VSKINAGVQEDDGKNDPRNALPAGVIPKVGDIDQLEGHVKVWILVMGVYAAPPNSIDWDGPWEFGMSRAPERVFKSEAECHGRCNHFPRRRPTREFAELLATTQPESPIVTDGRRQIVEKYGAAYTTAFNRSPNLKKYYIDAFSGAGVHISKTTGTQVEGSPARALNVSPPFDGFYFIDLDEDKTDYLRSMYGGHPGRPPAANPDPDEAPIRFRRRLSPTGKNQARDRTAWLGKQPSGSRCASLGQRVCRPPDPQRALREPVSVCNRTSLSHG
jgi:hypothetical protein